jgi:Phosphotransferase enzyme family
MEDLAARGVTFCHALKPHTHEQVARRLEALARFHAKTWDSPDSARFAPEGEWGRLVDFFDVMQPFFDDKSKPENWSRFISLPRGAAMSCLFHDRQWVLQGWDQLKRFSKQQPQCVLHGDVHLGNLYVDLDGTPGFFDTLASRGPGMLEVSYHVSAALDIADRPHSEGALVQHYLDELRRNGVAPPSFEEAMRQYGIFLLYGHFIWMTTEPGYQTESVNTANAARMSAAMIDHDVIGLFRALGSV